MSPRIDCPSTWKFNDDEVGVMLFSDFLVDFVDDVRDTLDDEAMNERSDTETKTNGFKWIHKIVFSKNTVYKSMKKLL